MLGFEEANFIERYSKLDPAELASSVQSPTAIQRIDDMVQRVTDPLWKERGIEAFRHNMVDAEFKLRSGLLCNPRELEVALLSSGRVSSKSAFGLLWLRLIGYSGALDLDKPSKDTIRRFLLFATMQWIVQIHPGVIPG